MVKKRPTDSAIAINKQARFEYEILEDIECGMVLAGTEVKSIRANGVRLSDCYAGIKEGGLYLFNLHISEYAHAHKSMGHELKRPRKLLLHKKQQNKLMGLSKKDGLTLVPLRMYFNSRGFVKLLLGVGRGKKMHDKREAAKQRDWNIDKRRIMVNKNRSF